MKKNKVLILAVCISNICLGQTIDTIDFWNGTKLITDLTLNDNENCLKVDTTIQSHACHNYFDEQIILYFYPHDKNICDSIISIKSEKERYRVLSKIRFDKFNSEAQQIRLLQDPLRSPNYYFSPEIIFQLEINKKKYNFSSIKTDFTIDKLDLLTGILIIERIPESVSYTHLTLPTKRIV